MSDIETFQVGRVVVIQTRHYGTFSYRVRIIERETKLYWVVDGEKYRKSDGHQPGEQVWIGHENTLISLTERNRRRTERTTS